MKKRLVNKKIRNDVYVKLWRKSIHEHMHTTNRIMAKHEISELELCSLQLSFDLMEFDFEQMMTHCKEKYHFYDKELKLIKL